MKILIPPVTATRASIGLLILRCTAGVALAVHGYGKYTDVTAFATEFSIPLPVAYLATLMQLAAGAALASGLLTPLSAAALASTMLVATAQLIARGEPWINPHGHSFESSFFYLVASTTLILCGPGRFSLDGILTRGRARQLNLEKEG